MSKSDEVLAKRETADGEEEHLKQQASACLKNLEEDQTALKKKRVEEAIARLGQPREELGLTSGLVEIVDFNPLWRHFFAVEREQLQRILGEEAYVRIEHVGSTSVTGMRAKPIIDIAIGFRFKEDIDRAIPKLLQHGYDYVPEANRFSRSKFFARGQPRLFHLHLVLIGSPGWAQLIYFRDILRASFTYRSQYTKYKERSLENVGGRQAGNRGTMRREYTKAKSRFIDIVNLRAIREARFRRYYKYIQTAQEDERYKAEKLLHKHAE